MTWTYSSLIEEIQDVKVEESKTSSRRVEWRDQMA
jgi:hypothetical protein